MRSSPILPFRSGTETPKPKPKRGGTPRKTNMSPENQWLKDVFPIEIVPFLEDMLVFGSVCVVFFWGYCELIFCS